MKVLRKIQIAIFLILIVMCNFSVHADEWTPIGVPNENGTLFYINEDSITEQDGYYFVWSLEDRKSLRTIIADKQRISYLSQITYRVINCSKKTSYVLKGSFFSKKHGHGKNLNNFESKLDTSKLESKIPNSWGSAIIESVCNSTNIQLKKIT